MYYNVCRRKTLATFHAIVALACTLACTSILAGPNDNRGIVLLIQGVGPIPSSKSAEDAWGRLNVNSDGDLRWSGFAGYLVHEQGWKIGGVLRPRSERVRTEDIDILGAAKDAPPDLFILASSRVAQRDGLKSLAREIATAVGMLRSRFEAKTVTLVCYSAGGIAARAWLQGAIPEMPYKSGMVSELVTVATPHLGIGGVLSPVTILSRRYALLQPESRFLRRLNEELDLPRDVRYTSIVVHGAHRDSARLLEPYKSFVKLPPDDLRRLPPLMRNEHDGVVHALSQQLHLSPVAARYENKSNRPVAVEFVRSRGCPNRAGRNLIPHASIMFERTFWQTLYSILDAQARVRRGESLVERSPKAWAQIIGKHLSEVAVEHHHLTGRVQSSEIKQYEISAIGKRAWRVRWRAECEIKVRRLLGGERDLRYAATGSFEIVFDRFGRPTKLRELVVEATRL